MAYTGEPAIVGGTWRLRLISSREQLAKLAREAPVSNFSVKEFKDYYLPNKKNIICRSDLIYLLYMHTGLSNSVYKAFEFECIVDLL